MAACNFTINLSASAVDLGQNIKTKIINQGELLPETNRAEVLAYPYSEAQSVALISFRVRK